MGAKILITTVLSFWSLQMAVANSDCLRSLQERLRSVDSETVDRFQAAEWRVYNEPTRVAYYKSYRLKSFPESPGLSVSIVDIGRGMLTVKVGSPKNTKSLKSLSDVQRTEFEALAKDVIEKALSHIQENSDVVNVRVEIDKDSREVWEKEVLTDLDFKAVPFHQSPETYTGVIVGTLLVYSPLTMLVTTIATWASVGFSKALMFGPLSWIASVGVLPPIFYALVTADNYVRHLFKYDSYIEFAISPEMRNQLKDSHTNS